MKMETITFGKLLTCFYIYDKNIDIKSQRRYILLIIWQVGFNQNVIYLMPTQMVNIAEI